MLAWHSQGIWIKKPFSLKSGRAVRQVRAIGSEAFNVYGEFTMELNPVLPQFWKAKAEVTNKPNDKMTYKYFELISAPSASAIR